MVCKYYKYPIFCEGKGILWDHNPEMIEVTNNNHTCLPNMDEAILNTTCYEASKVSVGNPSDLIRAVCEKLYFIFNSSMQSIIMCRTDYKISPLLYNKFPFWIIFWPFHFLGIYNRKLTRLNCITVQIKILQKSKFSNSRT